MKTVIRQFEMPTLRNTGMSKEEQIEEIQKYTLALFDLAIKRMSESFSELKKRGVYLINTEETDLVGDVSIRSFKRKIGAKSEKEAMDKAIMALQVLCFVCSFRDYIQDDKGIAEVVAYGVVDRKKSFVGRKLIHVVFDPVYFRFQTPYFYETNKQIFEILHHRSYNGEFEYKIGG